MTQTIKTSNPTPQQSKRWERAQIVKWTVYSLLIINTFFYAWQEAYIASNVLTGDATWADWAREFATVIDNFGWFGLLLAFELETYALSDETLERRKVAWSLYGIRLICYIMLAHTVVARVASLNAFEAVTQATHVTHICDVADQGISYDYNYNYTEVTSENCQSITTDDTFYFTDPTVITDSVGYELFKQLTYVDVIDVIAWLLVVWAIELTVWLQNRNITGGRIMLVTHSVKIFYAVLWIDAAWWIKTGNWVWAWDQALWIVGFWAIEKNLSEWRDEIREEHTNE